MGPKKLQKRGKNRTKMVVPVRLLINGNNGPQTFLAHTLDASASGARLGGFHGCVNVGHNVTIQYQHRRASFRVIWVGARGSAQSTQVGIECLEPGKDIWSLEKSADSVFEDASEQTYTGRMRWAFNGSF